MSSNNNLCGITNELNAVSLSDFFSSKIYRRWWNRRSDDPTKIDIPIDFWTDGYDAFQFGSSNLSLMVSSVWRSFDRNQYKISSAVMERPFI